MSTGGRRRRPAAQGRSTATRRTRVEGRYGRDLSPRHERRRSRATGVRQSSPSGPRRPSRLSPAVLEAYARPLARVGVLLAEVTVVLILLNGPAFATRQIDVTGLKHLTRQHILARAGLDPGSSVFLISTDGTEAELMGDPFVRSATVRAVLPDRVTVEVVEWEAVALLTRGPDHYLINQDGNVLARSTGTAVGRKPGQPRVPLTQEAAGTLRPGQNAINGRLLTDLDHMQDRFPSAYGLTVTRFVIQAGGQLVVETTAGPRILFGQMVTDEQIDSLDGKLAALKSLAGQADLAHSRLDYITLENPGAPATHSIPSPSPSARASSSPSPKHP